MQGETWKTLCVETRTGASHLDTGDTTLVCCGYTPYTVQENNPQEDTGL